MAWAAAIPALIQAGASIYNGYQAGKNQPKMGNPKETKMERTKRKLVDKLLSSLDGSGPFADLYNADEETFQKSFVDPAKSMFNNQIAPQIQQQYIANGQQRGTGLEDQLLRAGVDLDQLLNQSMMEYQQGAQNRKQSGINAILGGGSNASIPGQQQPLSSGQAFNQATSGYLASDAFRDTVSGAFKNQPMQQPSQNPYQPPPRKGFEPEWKDWSLGDPRWQGR